MIDRRGVVKDQSTSAMMQRYFSSTNQVPQSQTHEEPQLNGCLADPYMQQASSGDTKNDVTCGSPREEDGVVEGIVVVKKSSSGSVFNNETLKISLENTMPSDKQPKSTIEHFENNVFQYSYNSPLHVNSNKSIGKGKVHISNNKEQMKTQTSPSIKLEGIKPQTNLAKAAKENSTMLSKNTQEKQENQSKKKKNPDKLNKISANSSHQSSVHTISHKPISNKCKVYHL